MIDKKRIIKDVGKVFDINITFQKKIETEGPFTPLDEYEDFISVWAESKWLRGRNLYAARAANIKTDVEFVIRYREDIDEVMRVKISNKSYNIEGILPLDNTKKYLTIKAYEIKHDM